MGASSRNALAGLTAQQSQILKMLALGMLPKAIGPELGLSPKTVEFHIGGPENPRSIKRLLGLNRAGMVRYAVENGLVRPGDKAMNDNESMLPLVPPGRSMKTTSDLAQALLTAAAQASEGKANVLQVNVLCACTQALVNLTRMEIQAKLQLQANEKPGKQKTRVPWLEE
jgi:hypothetical protein